MKKGEQFFYCSIFIYIQHLRSKVIVNSGEGSWVRLEEEEMLVAVEEAVTHGSDSEGAVTEVLFIFPKETMTKDLMNVRTGSRASRCW